MKILKQLILLLITAGFIVIITACSGQPDTTDSQGKPIRLSDYKGKWVVINYWATWCKPCIKEIPALNNLYQSNAKKVIVLGVSYDQLNNEEIKEISKKMSVNYPMMSTFPLEKFGIKCLNVLPITFVITPEGKLVNTLKGPQTEAQFKEAVNLN